MNPPEETRVEERFAVVADAFRTRPDITLPRGGRAFGASALRVRGKIFAMVSSRREFVVKLPADRVKALVASGDGEPFGNGGRVMKEWVVVNARSNLDWLQLAEEALEWVRAAGGNGA